MDQLIKIHCDDSNEPMISGRELHGFLEVQTAYKDWFPRMCEYGFVEGEDFCSKMSESTGGRPAQDHLLKITMAKELCMLQRTEKGKQARQYFIAIESAWNKPEMVMARALKLADKQIALVRESNVKMLAQLEEQRPLVQFAKTCHASGDTLLVRDFAKVLCKDGFNIGERRLYQLLREWKLIYRNDGRNIPYQEYMDRGYFEISELPYTMEGAVKLALTTKITPKGQQYIINRLLGGKIKAKG